MVGGGSRSCFWNSFLSNLLNRKLSVCEQSEFGAALGVARLAMYADESRISTKEIIKEIKVDKEYKPKPNDIDLLMKRYLIWRDLYTRNKKN